ncbi:MAG: hypothetical protein L3J93_02875 [Thermoplasmata archaeon]|nr:hypothetical protein [Thermoplasmata archaeon]
MTDWISIFLGDPTLGLPVSLLAGTIVAWIAWNVSDRPMSVVRSTPHPIPDRDPVSRTYHAFESGEFSDVLVRGNRRLDRLALARYHRSAARLPRTPWGRRRIAPSDPEGVRNLRRLRDRAEHLLTITSRREGGIWVRLEFWRSRAELRRRFLKRLTPVLEEIDTVSTPLGGAA